MARPTAQVLTLLELLQSGGVRTMAELADRLGVDPRTVRRYVDHLIDLDVPVESVRGRYGGYRLAAGYRLPPLMLSDDEALAVLLGLVAGARRSGDHDRYGERDGHREDPPRPAARLAGPARRRTRIARLHRRPRRSPRRTAGSCSPSPTRSATTGRSRSSTPPRRAAQHRTLHPYGLVDHSGRWYVTGADPAIGEDRTFRLDRIADARTLPGSFEAADGV